MIDGWVVTKVELKEAENCSPSKPSTAGWVAGVEVTTPDLCSGGLQGGQE